MWGWIKRWFDPVTVSKIFILGPHDVIPVLTQFMDIKDIPKVYGGELDWSFFEEPAWGDEIKRICQFENGYTEFPPGPMYWVPIDDGKRIECLAVGTKDGKDRRERICTIAKAFPPQAATESAPPAENAAGTESVAPAEQLAELSVADEPNPNGTSKVSEKTDDHTNLPQESTETK